MKLALSDDFMDSLIRLPKNIQKKTKDFIKKFRETPDSNAINYEKISSFKDLQLRTVRIDQTYRAIIRAPKEGDLYHLLWVDHHDEAMNWAKNKVFEWNRLTTSFQIFDVKEESAPIIEKTEPVSSFMEKFRDEELLKIGIPEVLLGSIKKLDNLDELQTIEKFIPKEVFENLFYLFDGVKIENIIEEVEEGKLVSDNFNDQLKSINNQRFFLEISDDSQMEAILSDDFKKWKVFLHPSQRKLVNKNFKGTIKVSGGAGTGKTVAALHRAKWLCENNLISSSKPIFFTTFTKALSKNLAQSLNELDIDKTKVKLDNIHHFVIENVKALNLIPEKAKIIEFGNSNVRQELWEDVIDIKLSKYSSEFLEEEYQSIILHYNITNLEQYLRVPRIGRTQKIGKKDRESIWELVREYELRKKRQDIYDLDELFNLLSNHYSSLSDKPFSHIICDELQDFSNIELRLLRNLVAEGGNDLFMVGDPFQKIYDRNINFSSIGINIKGKRSSRLRLNYRTTEEIRRSAISVIEGIEFDNFDGEAEDRNGYLSLMKGVKPEYNVFQSNIEEVGNILTIIDEYTNLVKNERALAYNQICIAGRKKTDIIEIRKELHKLHIPYLDVAGDSEQGDRNGIVLSTLHSLKGLEFKIVILTNISEDTFPLKPTGFNNWSEREKTEHIKREKALLYVAMTRAIQGLFISGVGKKTKVLAI